MPQKSPFVVLTSGDDRVLLWIIHCKLKIMKNAAMTRITPCGLLLALGLPMCSKTGTAGATGTQGPAGPQGSKGDVGTANVVYSEWTDGFSGTSAIWAVSAITQGVLDSAAILVYVNQNGYVFPLPYDNVNGSGFYVNDLITGNSGSLRNLRRISQP
jgi:hypothetical protein